MSLINSLKKPKYKIIAYSFGSPDVGSIMEWSDMHDSYVVEDKKTGLCSIWGGMPDENTEYFERIGRFLIIEKIKLK